MRTLNEAEKDQLDNMMNEVWLSAILDHISGMTYEAADSVGHCEGGIMLAQQAAAVRAAGLFSKLAERL